MVLFVIKCFQFYINAFVKMYYDFTFLLASRFFRFLTFLWVDSSSELILAVSSPEWLWPCDGDLGASLSSSSLERLPVSLSSLSSPISASNKSSFSNGWRKFRKQIFHKIYLKWWCCPTKNVHVSFMVVYLKSPCLPNKWILNRAWKKSCLVIWVKVDSLAGKVTFKVHLSNWQGPKQETFCKRQARSGPKQAKCDSCLPKGQAVFFGALLNLA